ncbi:lipopolysaccharide kinase InaA family protein [Halorhodospira sp. 9622]|uniref:lipopolysaccharide kinase InaA family protein n=1 Tax=Halorhodospira sp. 9622 TaxID=2899136 RepID=UPI001EE80FFE|nr:lipopolysaccharide kinase InaA family protein [Halorhodospira sp. 9622]MCG5539065.1 lipopolysaccharide kinase InaA family protein [Halorhodospira sp. 9622]
MTRSYSIQKATAGGREIAEAVATVLERCEDPRLTLIKDSKARVYRFDDDLTTYYVKVYSPRNLRDRIALWLRPPTRLFRTAQQLQSAGIASPAPIAALTLYRPGRRLKAFIMTGVSGISLKHLSYDQVSKATGRELVAAAAALWGRLICHGFVHMDPIKENFLANIDEDSIHLAVIDLDNIRKPPFVPRAIRRRRLLKMAERHLFAATRVLREEPLPSGIIRAFIRTYTYHAHLALKDSWADWVFVGRRLATKSPRAAKTLSKIPLKH